jgi:signal transduction histidine kinase
MKSADGAIEALSVGVEAPAAVVLTSGLPMRAADHDHATEDFSAMRAEIQRHRQELNLCRATIDELRQELARTRAANMAKSELLAELGHELRTPLNAIIGFSEIIGSEALGPVGNPTYRDYLEDIIFCGRHLLGIVDDTLELARHEAGRVELREEHVAVETVVAEAIRLIGPQAKQARVGLSWRPPTGELPPLYCDRLRLRQILLNSLSNAVKFTEPGGRVEITTDLSDGLALVVNDTGVGIEPENIPVALSRFGQIVSDGPQQSRGAGLGLTVAKALAEQHGGSLSLQSTPLVGTTVRVSFPARRIGRRIAPRDSCNDASGALPAI